MEKKVKKGDVVTVYDEYSRTKTIIEETKVASAGKVWITTENSRMRYSAETFHSEYMGHALFFGTKEECKEWLERREKVRLMARELSQYFSIGVPDLDFTEEVYAMFEEYKNKD